MFEQNLAIADQDANPEALRLDLGYLEETAGTFGFGVLRDADLLIVAHKLATREELTEAELGYLTGGVSLPLLGKLTQIQGKLLGFSEQIRLRPVFYLPLSKLLDAHGQKGALDICLENVSIIDQKLQIEAPICIAIDSWSGAFTGDTFLSLCQELNAQVGKLTHKFKLLGPSTLDVLSLLEIYDIPEKSLSALFKALFTAGFREIEGGGDLKAHSEAASFGFDLTVGQSITSGKLSQTVEDILKIRAKLSPSQHFKVWFPWTSSVLDTPTNSKNGVLGLELLRVIALGRLLLPEVEYIRAPFSMMGSKAGHIALAYGANDIGFAAVDSQSAKALGVLKLSQVSNIINQHKAFARVEHFESIVEDVDSDTLTEIGKWNE